jgi:DNA ligase-1
MALFGNLAELAERLAAEGSRLKKRAAIAEAIAAVHREAPASGDAGAEVVEVRHAVMLEADLRAAAERAFAGTLGEARMRLFHPLGFMLASPVESAEEAVARFTEKSVKPAKRKTGKGGRGSFDSADHDGAVICSAQDDSSESEVDKTIEDVAVRAFLEDKYDGMRAQVHCGDPAQPGRVAIYSRNREDVTASFPELAEAFACALPDVDGSMVLDGEILGWDFAGAQALPFAVLGQRIGRKKVSNEWRRRVPVVFMAFDLMVMRGELVLGLPLRERRNRLEAIVEQMVDRIVAPMVVDERRDRAQREMFLDGWAKTPEERPLPRLMLSPSRLVESAEDIDRAYTEARARANEGVMLKAAESSYQPGRRGLAWVKLKRELATLDVVITGAEYGHGRRAALLSDYTFAVRGPGFLRTGELLNVGKAYSGLTDAEIAELTEFLKAHTLEDHGHFRAVEPLVVLEVAFNNIMRSDRHASGFALRFPRILRIRADKPLAEIDTVERVEEVYLGQVDRPSEEK